MAYASNALLWKHSDKKVTVVLILNDTDNMFKDFGNQGFVMAHTEDINGQPVIMLNGEKCTHDEWIAKCESKPSKMHKIGQLLTYPIWVCKKVQDFVLMNLL